MKSFAVAAFVAVAAAFPQYEVAPPAYNSTSAVETPAYSTKVEVPSYSAAPSTSAHYTTVECSGPTEIPVGPSHTYTYTASESTTLTFSYPVVEPTEGYTPVPMPTVPVYPTSNGTAPVPSVPAGTGAPAPPSGTGSYTPPSETPVPEFPGAAGKTGLSMLAVAGALAAFL